MSDEIEQLRDLLCSVADCPVDEEYAGLAQLRLPVEILERIRAAAGRVECAP